MNKSSRYLWFWVFAQASVIVAVIGLRIYLGPLPHTPITRARVDIAYGLKTALDAYAVDCGRYPTTSEGFAALITCPTNISGKRWHGSYLDKIPQDPWKHDYMYRCPGIYNTNGYDLYSCGYDGVSKSGGDDLDDINNWDHGSPHGIIVPVSRKILEGFQGTPVFCEIMFTLLTIPFFCGVQLIAGIFSQRVFESITRNPTVHIIWAVVSLAVFLIFLASLPPLIEM